jgi:hypothetical protein
VIVQPRTVISWQRKRLRDYWTRLSRHSKLGRPPVGKEIRDLIRKLSAANPTWGAPRIAGELGKLGIAVAKSTVEKYRVRASTPPSPTWRTFLATHAKDLVSIDFFTVATVRCEILIRAHYSRPRSAPGAALQHHGTPERRVDSPASGGGVPLGDRTAPPPA